jgi:hypothetical protein
MRKKWYVGISHKDGSYHAFTWSGNPTPKNQKYAAVIGPFKTKRAALWAEKHGKGNPHFQHVDDAERLAKGA